jgi:hypothetical protein
MRSQIKWREVTAEERRNDIPSHVKQLTGDNKSRPGARIRANDEDNFISIKSE